MSDKTKTEPDPPRLPAKKISVPPPPPAPWSRPRDDQQPTTEMPGAGLDAADNIRTAEMPAASDEASTGKLDKDELRTVREGSPKGATASTADGPVVPKIPVDDLKTDVMMHPPDFGEEHREALVNPLGPRPLPPNSIVTEAFELRRPAPAAPPSPHATLKWIATALAMLLVLGLAVWSVFAAARR